MNDTKQTKPSICIVAHNAYGVLAGVDTGHAGGIEVQTPLMARWLVNKGFAVSLITWDEGYEDGKSIDGVKVFKLCRKDEGLPILRFFTPRWSSLNAALKRADPDIIYYNCGDLGLGQVVLWAKFKNRKVMFSVPGNAGCLKNLPELKSYREKALYRYGLKNTNDIVVQTEEQKNMLLREFGLPATLIRMPSKGFPMEPSLRGPPQGQENMRILWVGRISEVKRIEWLLDLAEKRPLIQFDVVGDANSKSEYAVKQFERATHLSNVTMHGRMPHSEMGRFYEKAHLLCSTSIIEGFPNVYLEAWSTGLPLVSTFDPDGVVQKYKHGKIGNNVADLVEAVDQLSVPSNWDSASAAAKNYFHTFHEVDSCLNVFADQILKLSNKDLDEA